SWAISACASSMQIPHSQDFMLRIPSETFSNILFYNNKIKYVARVEEYDGGLRSSGHVPIPGTG
ncbi:MAG: hypothetical protein ACREEE_01440, partial [Dongiaceae bacterium]